MMAPLVTKFPGYLPDVHQISARYLPGIRWMAAGLKLKPNSPSFNKDVVVTNSRHLVDIRRTHRGNRADIRFLRLDLGLDFGIWIWDWDLDWDLGLFSLGSGTGNGVGFRDCEWDWDMVL